VGVEVDVGNAVRAGGELRGVAHRGHAVGTHIGADIHIDVAAQAEDAAVPVECHLDLAFGLARMSDGHEMLAPILHPFDRTAELAGRKGDQKILRIELAARPEAAADVEFEIIDRLLGKSHHVRHGAAIEEGQLGGAGNLELAGRRIPLGKQAARFHRHGGEPLGAKPLPARMGRGAERGFHVALAGRDQRGAIGAGAREQKHIASRGCIPVRHRRQMLDVEDNSRSRILGELRGVGEHHRQGLAHIPQGLLRDHRLRIGSNGRIGPAKRNGRDRLADVGGGQDRVDPRHGERRRRFDRADAAMGHGAAHDRGAPLAGAAEIIEILPATAQEAKILDPLDRAADQCIYPAHGGLVFLVGRVDSE